MPLINNHRIFPELFVHAYYPNSPTFSGVNSDRQSFTLVLLHIKILRYKGVSLREIQILVQFHRLPVGNIRFVYLEVFVGRAVPCLFLREELVMS